MKIKSGLVFAKLHLMMEIDVQDSVVVAFSKRISHTPVPAASASVRLVLELLIFGNDQTVQNCLSGQNDLIMIGMIGIRGIYGLIGTASSESS